MVSNIPMTTVAGHQQGCPLSRRNKSGVRYIACALAIISASSCVRTVAPNGSTDVAPAEAKFCDNEDVCVVVDFGCGMERGYRAAVNQEFANAVEPTIDSLGYIGTSRDPTCWNPVRTACIAYLCELVLSPEVACNSDDPTCAKRVRPPF